MKNIYFILFFNKLLKICFLWNLIMLGREKLQITNRNYFIIRFYNFSIELYLILKQCDDHISWYSNCGSLPIYWKISRLRILITWLHYEKFTDSISLFAYRMSNINDHLQEMSTKPGIFTIKRLQEKYITGRILFGFNIFF